MEVTLKTDSERFSDDTGKGEEQKEKQDISEKSLDSEFAEDEDDACYDDPEGFVDNISDEALLGDALKERPVEEKGFDRIIVVDNAPKVGPERMPKLKEILGKVFKRFGTIVFQHYPLDEKGIFKGFFFLEYETQEQAAEAVKTSNGYQLDKAHIFAVNFFTDIEKYADFPTKWDPPEKKEFVEKGNLRSWLLEPDAHDQYAVIHSGGKLVSVYKNTPFEAQLLTARPDWTETYVRWSPMGTYLATLHSQGVALWGGDDYKRIAKFAHPGVQYIDFSPCERYLVTLSPVVEDPHNPQNIIVWDIRSEAKKRTFIRGTAEEWPILKWSSDGSYFARVSDNQVLSIYETPSFGLLDKKSVIIKGIRECSWSPAGHMISYWVPESNDIPAKITIMAIPSRAEISTKSRHLVNEFKLHWHKQGDYLCVKVDHWTSKNKKQLCNSFEIFHLRDVDVPVDTLEIKEPVLAHALEPYGKKLAVIHGEPGRVNVSFFLIGDKGTKIVTIKVFEKHPVNHIFWSPQGQFLVLAGLKSGTEGQMEFVDSGDMSIMNKTEHTKATDLEWDPTGRYVVTSVSFWTQKMDTGYIVWSFQGKLLYRSSGMDKFCQLFWRPRPPSLLTEEDLKRIKKDYKKYNSIFEQKDHATKNRASKELLEKRRALMDSFLMYQMRREAALQKMQQRELEINEPLEKEVYEEEKIDVLLDVIEEII